MQLVSSVAGGLLIGQSHDGKGEFRDDALRAPTFGKARFDREEPRLAAGRPILAFDTAGIAVSSAANGRTAASRIVELLREQDLPWLRRAIEATLVFEMGFHPVVVTDALRELSIGDVASGIVRSDFTHGGETSHIYTCNREPRAAEIERLHALYSERQYALPNAVLRDAGERYVRAILKQSRRFHGITQVGRLGRLVDAGGKNALDLLATDNECGTTFGISVKNQREFLSGGSSAIKDCFTKAKAHGVKPWLFTAFAMPEAVVRCKRDDIRLTVLGRQVVPATDSDGRHMRWVISRLRRILGPQPYEFLYEHFDQSMRSSAVGKDIASLADPRFAVAA